jgi:hypothetical protein
MLANMSTITLCALCDMPARFNATGREDDWRCAEHFDTPGLTGAAAETAERAASVPRGYTKVELIAAKRSAEALGYGWPARSRTKG